MLQGLRVLDLADEWGWLAGKVLGDMGADVIELESPGGDLAGRRGPYLDGIADPERSLARLALNTSKRGIALELATRATRARCARPARTSASTRARSWAGCSAAPMRRSTRSCARRCLMRFQPEEKGTNVAPR